MAKAQRNYPRHIGARKPRQSTVITSQAYEPRNPRRPGRRKPVEARRPHETKAEPRRGRVRCTESKYSPRPDVPPSAHEAQGLRSVRQFWAIAHSHDSPHLIVTRRRRRLLTPVLRKLGLIPFQVTQEIKW